MSTIRNRPTYRNGLVKAPRPAGLASGLLAARRCSPARPPTPPPTPPPPCANCKNQKVLRPARTTNIALMKSVSHPSASSIGVRRNKARRLRFRLGERGPLPRFSSNKKVFTSLVLRTNSKKPRCLTLNKIGFTGDGPADFAARRAASFSSRDPRFRKTTTLATMINTSNRKQKRITTKPSSPMETDRNITIPHKNERGGAAAEMAPMCRVSLKSLRRLRCDRILT